MARALDQFPIPPIDELHDQLAVLERRLEEGDRQIDLVRRTGRDVHSLETFWIDLLRQYEAVADGLSISEAA